MCCSRPNRGADKGKGGRGGGGDLPPKRAPNDSRFPPERKRLLLPSASRVGPGGRCKTNPLGSTGSFHWRCRRMMERGQAGPTCSASVRVTSSSIFSPRSSTFSMFCTMMPFTSLMSVLHCAHASVHGVSPRAAAPSQPLQWNSASPLSPAERNLGRSTPDIP